MILRSVLLPRHLHRLNKLLLNVRLMSSVPNGSSSSRRRSVPDGVWPTMITPFLNDASKSVDWNALDCESTAECACQNHTYCISIPNTCVYTHAYVHTCIMVCTHIHGIYSADKLVHKLRLLRHLLCVSIKRNVPGKYYIYIYVYISILHVMMSE